MAHSGSCSLWAALNGDCSNLLKSSWFGSRRESWDGQGNNLYLSLGSHPRAAEQHWEATTTPSGNLGCPKDDRSRSSTLENKFVGLARAELKMWGVRAHSGCGLSKTHVVPTFIQTLWFNALPFLMETRHHQGRDSGRLLSCLLLLSRGKNNKRKT